jgi:hypothetical protein
VLNGRVALLGLNNVELDVVGLRHSADGGRASVVLENPKLVSNDIAKLLSFKSREDVPRG